MTPARERRLLQMAIAIGGLVPVGAGLGGMLLGARFVAAAGLPADSHVRYLSGLLLGIGLAFWAAIPTIERQRARISLLTGFVVLGGLGRLLGVVVEGWPGAAMTFGLVMELVVTPALWLWQGHVARRCPAA